MITVTRLNGPAFALNPDLIERVEATPDTVIHLVGGTNYVVVETVALVRSRLGIDAVRALIDGLLPATRVEMVDRSLHDKSLSAHRRLGGGTSFVDRVTLTFAARGGIQRAFAFDVDLVTAGLRTAVRET